MSKLILKVVLTGIIGVPIGLRRTIFIPVLLKKPEWFLRIASNSDGEVRPLLRISQNYNPSMRPEKQKSKARMEPLNYIQKLKSPTTQLQPRQRGYYCLCRKRKHSLKTS